MTWGGGSGAAWFWHEYVSFVKKVETDNPWEKVKELTEVRVIRQQPLCVCCRLCVCSLVTVSTNQTFTWGPKPGLDSSTCSLERDSPLANSMRAFRNWPSNT